MLIIILVLMAILFPVSMIFIKKKVLKISLVIVSFALMVTCETLLILNDTRYFGMIFKEEKVSENIKSSDKNKNILFYSEDTIMPIYLYLNEDNQPQITMPTDQVIIKRNLSNDSQARADLINKNIYFKNSFYSILYAFVRSEGQTISSKVTLNLPEDWTLEKSLTLGQ